MWWCGGVGVGVSVSVLARVGRVGVDGLLWGAVADRFEVASRRRASPHGARRPRVPARLQPVTRA